MCVFMTRALPGVRSASQCQWVVVIGFPTAHDTGCLPMHVVIHFIGQGTNWLGDVREPGVGRCRGEMDMYNVRAEESKYS